MASVETVGGAGEVSPVRRVRGKSKRPNWRYDGPLAVIPLDLDVAGDPHTRHRVEQQFSAAFALSQALKRDARTRCRSYWAAARERDREGPGFTRERLGLSRASLEAAAYRHVERSRWMRDHLTKAVACHMAAGVWAGVQRNLYVDACGKRFGIPRLGRWWDFTRIAGRARSHTKQRVWETWRLTGSLDGHFAVYGTGGYTGLQDAQTATAGVSVLAQPSTVPAPSAPTGGWWDHRGALAVVFTGLPAGDLILPVRLPQGRGDLDRLMHFLADSSRWHKIDLVRHRDRKAPGGWRYQAHLTILGTGYQSPATRRRRGQVPGDRLAGLDANVSNIAVASTPAATHTGLDRRDDALLTAVVTPTADQQRCAAAAAVKARRRSRALDRSRRATNRHQYTLSRRQQARAQRRRDDGLSGRTVDVPRGQRDSDTAGRPKQSYRRDLLSGSYRRMRADHAGDASATVQRKHAAAEHIAARLVAAHGNHWVTEDVDITNWMRLWGKRIAITTPGRITAALKREALACGGTWQIASTKTTAMSQHCLCGQREKKTLHQRWHSCPNCGLEADRDILAAALAACTTFTDPQTPSTARVDPTLTAVFARRVGAQQEGRVRSTIAYRETSSAGGSLPPRKTAAGHNDSPGPTRNRRPTPTRWELSRRHRNSRTNNDDTRATAPPSKL